MDRKLKAGRFGRFAEALAAWSLRLKGYRIIARHGKLVAFIEVKARRDITDAARSLRPCQAKRIIRAAEAYLQARPSLGGLVQRFDVILVSPWRLPVHLVDAWRPEF